MEFRFLDINRPKVEEAIESVFIRYRKETGQIDGQVKSIIEELEEFNNRDGKRIRPILVLLGYHLFGGRDSAIIRVAASMELVHAFLLIHDDIMDKSSLRRGKPAMHKIYAARKDEEYGISNAIVAGDTLLFIAYQNILDADLEGKHTAIEMLNRIILNTCYGQIIDFNLDKPDEDKILKVYKLKTSMYTIEGPLSIGARLAGATEEQLKILHDFSLPLGIAFQIQDDLLDVFPEVPSGKEAYKDLKEGKRTILIEHAMKNADPGDRVFLEQKLGKSTDEETLERMKSMLDECGAKEHSLKLIKEFSEQSFKVLEDSGLNDDQKGMLRDFAHLILERKK